MDAPKLSKQLRKDEGLKLKVYKDSVGKLTIGVGRNLEDTGVTEEEATLLLSNDIARTKTDLDKALPWWRELDDARQNVLMNMAFNMGTSGLLEFKVMLGAARLGNWQAAHDAMLNSRWARQVGGRAERLATTMLTGEF